MRRLRRFILAICVLGLSGLISSSVVANNDGPDPPKLCYNCTDCDKVIPAGPTINCSPVEQCTPGTCFSRSEGNVSESYSGPKVSSATGAQLTFSLAYNSYNADASRSHMETVLGVGWTHSYNIYLFSVRGHMFRVGADGRITKYQLGLGGTFTAAPGYFEQITKNPDGSFTITQKDQTAFRFDIIGGTHFLQGMPVWRLTRITDRNNNVTTLNYSAGNLMSVTDTYGRNLTFSYNLQNKLVGATDPLGRVTSLTYDATGSQLVAVTDPKGQLIQYSYNELAQITSKTDKDGRTFSYTYSKEKPTGIIDAAGAPYFSQSNPLNWATDATQLALNLLRVYVPSTTSKTDGRGNVWTYAYDLHGYITRMTAPDGATWNYSYDATTLMPASETDANDHTTLYQYDTQGNLIRKTDALGNITTYTYEPVFNMMTSITDANGRVTTSSYDSLGNRLQESDPLGGTRMWTYDPHGNMLSETDKNGNVTIYSYDALGNRVKSTDAVGNVTTMTYDVVGNLTSRTNARGFTTTYQYDGLNRLVQETDTLNHVTQSIYDGQGNRIELIDRNGNAARYEYDLRQRPTQAIDALNQTSTQSYDANDNRASVTDKNGHTTHFDYDVQNRLVRAIDALGNVVTMSYDPVGNKVTETDANGHTTAYQYDALNRQVRRIDAEGNVRQMLYDMVGLTGCSECTGPTKGSSLLTEQIDAEGKVIYFKYDGLDRLIIQNHKQTDTADVIDSDDAVARYTYDAQGNRLILTEPDGNTTSYLYDALNRQVKVTNAAGDMTLVTYDGNSNIETVTAPNLNVTTKTYDALDRLTQIDDSVGRVANYTYDPVGNRVASKDGNGNGSTYRYDAIYRIIDVTDALGETTERSYDPMGNLLGTTDRQGNPTRYVYDSINRRTRMTDALGNVTLYQYDGVGNRTRLIDANAHATDYAYDGVNRLIKETYADGGMRSFSYDRVSNIKTRTDQKGQVTTYSYSDLYFPLQRSYFNPASPSGPSDNMTYDLSGRMLTAERGGWLVTFTYDGANRVINTTQNTKPIGYFYDIPGRKRTVTYPGGRSIVEHTDARARLGTIDDPSSPPPIVQYQYDLGNRVLLRTYRNDTTASYSYNANNWVVNLDHSKGVLRIAGFGYDFDNQGNKRFEQKLADGANSNARSEAYQYDTTYRLVDYRVGTLIGSTVPVPSTQTQYTLDPVGNWTVKTKDLIPEPRMHSVTNEITQIGAVPIVSDGDGNTSEDGLYRYAYDEENRLSTVTRKSDSAVVGRYAYDALSRRIVKIANPAGVPATTGYFYDAARIIEEQSAAGATQSTYVYGTYIDEILTMDRGGQTYYYHQNSLWSVAAVTDSAGNVAERYAYDVYGLPIVETAAGVALPLNAWGTPHSAIGNPRMFTGRELDEETGIYFYRARYYDPTKGRFLQRDPMGYVDGMNLYAAYFVPNGVDPTGKRYCTDILRDIDGAEGLIGAETFRLDIAIDLRRTENDLVLTLLHEIFVLSRTGPVSLDILTEERQSEEQVSRLTELITREAQELRDLSQRLRELRAEYQRDCVRNDGSLTYGDPCDVLGDIREVSFCTPCAEKSAQVFAGPKKRRISGILVCRLANTSSGSRLGAPAKWWDWKEPPQKGECVGCCDKPFQPRH